VTPRRTCDECGRDVAPRTDGRLRVHGSGGPVNAHCPGSGAPGPPRDLMAELKASLIAARADREGTQ
jgi:hypothetical protein